MSGLKENTILVSACLTGVPCRMDGQSKMAVDIAELVAEGKGFPVCPEVMGGLPTPRAPSERQRDGSVMNSQGTDVTEAFESGAQSVLDVAQLYGCLCAIMKSKSPSCGYHVIHNGKFDGGLVEGHGVCVEKLLRAGIPVMTEREYTGAFVLRKICKEDDATIEQIVRSCLLEFGASPVGTALADPDLGRFSEIYQGDGRCYWVIESADGEILGGAGIGPLPGASDVCELQKMYCIPKARGTGVAQLLMRMAMDYASLWYSKCYLESLASMTAAHRFYEKHGFQRIQDPMGDTGHNKCDVFYLKSLKDMGNHAEV